jgi:hypothetical protein
MADELLPLGPLTFIEEKKLRADDQNTPDKVASRLFNKRCQLACTQIYNDKEEKSVAKGCELIEDLFFGKTVLFCSPAIGQGNFQTKELYLREVLLNSPDLEIDPIKLAYYYDVLGNQADLLEKRIENGDVILKRPTRPITYASFRKKFPNDPIGAMMTFMIKSSTRFNRKLEQTSENNENLTPKANFMKVINNEICSKASDVSGISYNLYKGNIAQLLQTEKFVLHRTDARKMADDIIREIPKCRRPEIAQQREARKEPVVDVFPIGKIPKDADGIPLPDAYDGAWGYAVYNKNGKRISRGLANSSQKAQKLGNASLQIFLEGLEEKKKARIKPVKKPITEPEEIPAKTVITKVKDGFKWQVLDADGNVFEEGINKERSMAKVLAFLSLTEYQKQHRG